MSDCRLIRPVPSDSSPERGRTSRDVLCVNRRDEDDSGFV